MCWNRQKNIKTVTCQYCFNKVDKYNAVCHVFSLGKLNGLYLCNHCLLDKQRRNRLSIIRGDITLLKKEKSIYI